MCLDRTSLTVSSAFATSPSASITPSTLALSTTRGKEVGLGQQGDSGTSDGAEVFIYAKQLDL